MKKFYGIILLIAIIFPILCGLGIGEKQSKIKDFKNVKPTVRGGVDTKYFCNGTKTVTNKGDFSEFVNYSKGYAFNVPSSVEYDFSRSPVFVDAFNKDFTLRVTREWSPYDDVEGYIDYYFNRFIDSEEWREANRVKSVKSVSENAENAESFIADRDDYLLEEPGENKFDRYSFIIIRNNERVFYCMTFKYNNKDSEKMDKTISMAVDSFRTFEPKDEDVFSVDYHPVIPENWTQETKDLYNKIINTTSDNLLWGIFADDVYNTGIEKLVSRLEKKMDYEFPVVLSYMHFEHDFPLEFMKRNWDNGKIVELTYQITDSNNENLFGYTPNMDIYRGLKDEEIRKLARDAKEFGHPFLFRLNNEMNSDWTSYGGVVNMKDPDIYVSNYRRFYRIFEEEGANNVIWIFNPNDRNYPPCDWNNYLAYYPGNDYVHMIGVTGYNTGTYYAEEMGETWREFEEIYDAIQKEYEPLFSEFPWIITEFSSSSVGGDKAQWITNMFNCIDKYKNIKIAVWFSFADYDYRTKVKYSVVSRPYWLDETPATLQAFINGLNQKSYNN